MLFEVTPVNPLEPNEKLTTDVPELYVVFRRCFVPNCAIPSESVVADDVSFKVAAFVTLLTDIVTVTPDCNLLFPYVSRKRTLPFVPTWKLSCDTTLDGGWSTIASCVAAPATAVITCPDPIIASPPIVAVIVYDPAVVGAVYVAVYTPVPVPVSVHDPIVPPVADTTMVLPPPPTVIPDFGLPYWSFEVTVKVVPVFTVILVDPYVIVESELAAASAVNVSVPVVAVLLYPELVSGGYSSLTVKVVDSAL